jgi:hypothetical protein
VISKSGNRFSEKLMLKQKGWSATALILIVTALWIFGGA